MKNNPYEAPAPFEADLAEEVQAGWSAPFVRQSVTYFRVLLILYPLLIIAGIIAAFAQEAFLPEELRLYEESQIEQRLTAAMVVIIIFTLISLLADFVGWIGMLFFWRPARWIFLVSQCMFLAVTLFFGPSVSHSITDTLEVAGSIVTGAILAMAFFSPVRERFLQRKTM
jgi:hypothetical protein